MLWDQNRGAIKEFCVGAAAIGAIAMATPAIAQSLVVRSTGPSAAQYPAGKKIAASGKVTLKRGDRITVLNKGKTRVLTGPGTFSLNRSTSASKTSNRVASFVATGPRRRARTGAVRGAGASETPNPALAKRSPNLWFVDVSRGGKYCVVKPEQILLWRPETAADQTVKLADKSGSSAQLNWRRGNPLKRWPNDEVAAQNGGNYVLAPASDGNQVSVTFAFLPEVPEGLDATAEMLLANGCEQQLDLLVETLASNDADSGGAKAEG